jgi:succinoglycan biosynthesis protein ExoL
MTSIAFLLPSLDHPRFVKRVNSAMDMFDNVVVFSYVRKMHQYGGMNDKVETVSLGEVEDGNYLHRPASFMKALRIVKHYVADRNVHFDHVCTFNIETAYLARLSLGWENMVYEVGDLVATTLNPVLRSVYRVIEREVYQSARKVVFTSYAFLKYVEDEYSISINDKTIVIENKLSKNVMNFTPNNNVGDMNDGGKIRIGLIGVLRFKAIEQLLECVKTRRNELELHVWGVGPYTDKVIEFAQQYDNISFYGKFSSPGDLPDIYSKIDLNFVVYDTSIPNVRVALPNKLYESQFFEVPLLVSENTELWRSTVETNSGFSIDDQNETALMEFFKNTSIRDIQTVRNSMKLLHKKSLVNSEDDFKRIFIN